MEAESHPASRDPSTRHCCTRASPLFHLPEISALVLSAKHFCCSPEVPDSLALPKQQGWEVRAVTSLFSRLVDTLERMMSPISSFSCPHWHIPERSGCGCSCSCRVLQRGHSLREGSPTKPVRNPTAEIVPGDPTGRDEGAQPC